MVFSLSWAQGFHVKISVFIIFCIFAYYCFQDQAARSIRLPDLRKFGKNTIHPPLVSCTQSQQTYFPCNLSSIFNSSNFPSKHVVVGNGSCLPISHVGFTTLPASPSSLALNHVLVAPQMVKKFHLC